jgi:hypothetical protein
MTSEIPFDVYNRSRSLDLALSPLPMKKSDSPGNRSGATAVSSSSSSFGSMEREMTMPDSTTASLTLGDDASKVDVVADSISKPNDISAAAKSKSKADTISTANLQLFEHLETSNSNLSAVDLAYINLIKKRLSRRPKETEIDNRQHADRSKTASSDDTASFTGRLFSYVNSDDSIVAATTKAYAESVSVLLHEGIVAPGASDFPDQAFQEHIHKTISDLKDFNLNMECQADTTIDTEDDQDRSVISELTWHNDRTVFVKKTKIQFTKAISDLKVLRCSGEDKEKENEDEIEIELEKDEPEGSAVDAHGHSTWQKEGTDFLDAANYHLTKALVDFKVVDCATALQSEDPGMSDVEYATNDRIVIIDQACGILDDCKKFEYKLPTKVPACQYKQLTEIPACPYKVPTEVPTCPYKLPTEVPACPYKLLTEVPACQLVVEEDSSTLHVVKEDSSTLHAVKEDSSTLHVVKEDSSTLQVVEEDSSTPQVIEDDSSTLHVYDSFLNMECGANAKDILLVHRQMDEDFQAASPKAFVTGEATSDTVDTVKSQVQSTTASNPFCLFVVDDNVAVEIDHAQEVVEVQSYVEPTPAESSLPLEEVKMTLQLEILQLEEKLAAMKEPEEKAKREKKTGTRRRSRLSDLHKNLLRGTKERQTDDESTSSSYVSFNPREWAKRRRNGNRSN